MRAIIKTIIFGLLVLPVTKGIAQTKSYTLSGVVKGISQGTVEFTSYDFRERQNKTIASGSIQGGKFKITGKLPNGTMTRMVINPGAFEAPIFLENSDISFGVDTAGGMQNTNGGQKIIRLKNVSVKGSKGHEEFISYEATLPRAANKMEFITNYVTAHPSSVFASYLIDNHYITSPGSDISGYENLLSKLTGEAQTSTYAKSMLSDLEQRKKISIGNKIEDFTLLTKDSVKVTLSELNRNKYVLIDFWASWCKPCRAAIPHWKEVYAKYKDNGFDILSITLDMRHNEWKKAMDEEQMPWTQVADEYPVIGKLARVFARYKQGTIPFYILLDKDGKILARSSREKDIDIALEKVFTDKD